MGVIEFKKPEVEEVCEEHLSGYARCAQCKGEWIAVVPVGTSLFECPSCKAIKAYMIGACMPGSGVIWQCPCGCDLFRITGKGTMCINCGKHQIF